MVWSQEKVQLKFGQIENFCHCVQKKGIKCLFGSFSYHKHVNIFKLLWRQLASWASPHPCLTYDQLEVIQMSEHAHQAGADRVKLLQSLGPVNSLRQDALVGSLLFTMHLFQQSLLLTLAQTPHQTQPLDNHFPRSTGHALTRDKMKS